MEVKHQWEHLLPIKRIKVVWKLQPEDFIVKEITERYGLLDPDKITYKFNENTTGDHLVCIFIKKNVETFKMIKLVSMWLNVSPKRINLAGIKDKKAYTVQLGSIYKTKLNRVLRLNKVLKNIRVIPLEYSEKKVHLGALKGNFFEVTIRGISKEDIDVLESNLKLYQQEYDMYFPNYYGIQRFGDEKKSGAVLGYLLLKREYEKFIEYYLQLPKPIHEISLEELEEHKKKISKKYYENRMLDYIISHQLKDVLGSMRVLPTSLIRMLISAYQSYLFNTAVSEFLKENKDNWREMINLHVSIPGEGHEIEVTPHSIEKRMREIMAEHGISTEDFIFKEWNIEINGTTRMVLQKPEGFSYVIKEDEKYQGKYKVIFKFSLPKGTYASSLLEEFFYLLDNL